MGTVICAGLGPGDPELMTVKAKRAVESAKTIAYFRKPGRNGQARGIVEGLLRPDIVELPMEYPVTTELPVDSADYNDALNGFYDSWAQRLAALEDVVVLCEGEPFFYGSFMHLYIRLQDKNNVKLEVIPGIPGMVGCWNRLGPFTWGDDVLSVIPGTLNEADILAQMDRSDAFVVMKIGRNFTKIRRALAAVGRIDEATLVSHGTMPNEKRVKVAEIDGDVVPYFSLILVPGNGRRPEAR